MLSAAKERAEVELLKIHPDFADIRESDDFHNWAEEQPQWVQNALYENKKMQGQQQEPLISINLIEAWARRTQARVARMLLKQLVRKIKQVFQMQLIKIV